MKFQYRAKDRGGEAAQGELDAESIADARNKLRNQGLFVLELAAATSARRAGATSFNLRRAASKADILILLSQLTIMMQSGVDLAESLRNLAEQCSKPALKAVLHGIYSDVSSGVSFSAALRRHPEVFDETFVAVIAAGECSGTMTAVLERLTGLMRGELRLRNTVWSMLMYPLVLCSVTFLVLNALVFFVLPQFATVFVEMGRSPPPLTAVLLAIGAFAKQHAMALGSAGLALVAGWYFLRATPPVRRAYDYFILHAVIVRQATRSLITGRLFRLLGTMLQTGVPMLDCIRLSRGAVKNVFFRRMFDVIEHDVLHGQGMAKSLLLVPFLPVGAAHMVATAEKSGRLGHVLQMVGEFYEDDGERHLRNMIKVLEPAIILGLGAVVASVVLSVVLPLLDMSTLSH
jgi:type II secretory pathway component PulF